MKHLFIILFLSLFFLTSCLKNDDSKVNPFAADFDPRQCEEVAYNDFVDYCETDEGVCFENLYVKTFKKCLAEGPQTESFFSQVCFDICKSVGKTVYSCELSCSYEPGID